MKERENTQHTKGDAVITHKIGLIFFTVGLFLYTIYKRCKSRIKNQILKVTDI